MNSLNSTCVLPHVGFPIRIPTDQWLFAPPRGFSQLIASFIGSWCQGIPLALFYAWPFLSYVPFKNYWAPLDFSYQRLSSWNFVPSFRTVTSRSQFCLLLIFLYLLPYFVYVFSSLYSVFKVRLFLLSFPIKGFSTQFLKYSNLCSS